MGMHPSDVLLEVRHPACFEGTVRAGEGFLPRVGEEVSLQVCPSLHHYMTEGTHDISRGAVTLHRLWHRMTLFANLGVRNNTNKKLNIDTETK